MTAIPSHPLQQDCQRVSRILARIAEKWRMLDVMLLRDGPCRFNDIKRNTAGGLAADADPHAGAASSATASSAARFSRPARRRSNTR